MANRLKWILGLGLVSGAVHVLDALGVSSIVSLVQKSWYQVSGYNLTIQLVVGAILVVLTILELKKR